MAPAEWDSNSSSPRLRWCRPRALILSDGTFPAGTPPHLPSHTHVFPITALVNSALGVLPQNDVPDFRSWRLTRISPYEWAGLKLEGEGGLEEEVQV